LSEEENDHNERAGNESEQTLQANKSMSQANGVVVLSSGGMTGEVAEEMQSILQQLKTNKI
jgi:hypothetical protein